MNSSTSRGEIVIMSREVVSHLAPEEMEFFDEIQNQFDRDSKSFKGASRRDDPLQFGLHDAAPLMTPAVIAAVTAVFHYLETILSQVVKNVAGTVLKERICTVLSHAPSKLVVTPEQFVEIHRMAQREAMKYGVTDPAAKRMADQIVRSLRG
jgi:hypothetical protein